MSENIKPLSNDTDETRVSQTRRRRFVRGVGVAMLPVTLTVASRSSLAAACFTASASASLSVINASRPDRAAEGECSGLSPALWANVAANNYPLNNPSFNSIYTGGTTQNMRQLLRDENAEAFDKYMAAAWCNFASVKVPATILTLTQLQAMWASRNLDNFQPVSGVFWGKSQIMAYLQSTWS